MAEKQIFIKIENFNDTVDVIELIKGKVKESKTLLQKMKMIKTQEEELMNRWAGELDEIEKRFSYVTDSFSETGE